MQPAAFEEAVVHLQASLEEGILRIREAHRAELVKEGQQAGVDTPPPAGIKGEKGAALPDIKSQERQGQRGSKDSVGSSVHSKQETGIRSIRTSNVSSCSSTFQSERVYPAEPGSPKWLRLPVPAEAPAAAPYPLAWEAAVPVPRQRPSEISTQRHSQNSQSSDHDAPPMPGELANQRSLEIAELQQDPPQPTERQLLRTNTEKSGTSEQLSIAPVSQIWAQCNFEKKRSMGLSSQASMITPRKSPAGLASQASLAYMMTLESMMDPQGDSWLAKWHVPWSPHALSRISWDITGMFLILIDLLLLPLQAFDPPIQEFQNTFSLITLIFWTVDIVLSFLTGYQVRGLVEYKFYKVAKNYLRTWFAFDIFVVTSDWFVTFHDGLSEGGVSTSQLKAGKAIRLFRMARLGRLLKLRGTLKELILRVRSQAFRIVLGIGKLLLFIMFVNHVVACLWFGVGKLARNNDSPNWIDANDLWEEDILYQYMTSLHWSWTQFTPASMEVVPTNSPERIYTVCTLLFAMVTFSSFVSSITNAMTQLRNLNAEKEHNHTLLRQYMMENECSVKLASHIWAFIDTIEHDRASQRKQEQDVPLLQKLPHELRFELADSAYLPVFKKYPFFDRFSTRYPDVMHKVYLQALEESSIGLGHELFDVGKRATQMPFVVNGQITYIMPTHEVLVERGGWLCEAALWLDWEHSGRAVATLRSDLISIQTERFGNLIQNEFSGLIKEAVEYAAAFHAFFDKPENKEDGLLSDVFLDMAVLRDMSTAVFGSPNAAPRLRRGVTNRRTRSRFLA